MNEEHREVVIRIRPRPASGKRRHLTAEWQLGQELKAMRRQGYEVDIYLRGTWIRANGATPTVFPETLVKSWRVVGDELQGVEESLPKGDWVAMPTRNPPPELVLRGVRRA